MSARVFALLNNRVGHRIAELLAQGDDEIVGAALHPPGEQAHGDEIRDALDLPSSRLFDARSLSEPETQTTIAELDPEIGVCAYFGYILDEALLDLFPERIVNVHPAYLPYNRGAYPNVWSIVDGTPAGVTIHYLDPDIDTGAILARESVEVEPVDTGRTLYRKLEDQAIALFEDRWPAIRAGDVDAKPQDPDEGTYHETGDVEEIDEIDLDETYQAGELLDILRARTFPPHESAYFVEDGRKVYVRVELGYADDQEDQ